jgi:2,3-bisphosphoglycerate-dependent phosphoglycerate mutase
MKQNIYLFRHGELHPKKNILCGWLNLPLSEVGLKQAEVLAKKLEKEKIDVAFCSNFLRSQQVVVSVLKYHPEAKVIIDYRLRERHYGPLSGELESVFADTSIFKNEKNGKIVENVPGIESMDVLKKRVFPFMTELLRYMQKEKVNVAISAHKNSLELIQEYLEGITPDKVEKFADSPTNYKKYVITFD